MAAGHEYVIYDSEVRSGGTVAWRNNNPGNIRDGAGLIFGAIGRDTLNHFLIFPDEATGHQAIIQQLHHYGHITLWDAINKWAPAADHNDPQAYANTVAKQLGVPVTTYIDTLSDTQFSTMADAIKRVEGWTPGNSVPRNDPTLPAEVRD